MGIKKVIITALLAVLLFTSIVQAQGQETLSLSMEQVIERAVAESEAYRIQDNTVQKLQQQYREVKATIYPQVNGSVAWVNNYEYPDKAKAQMTDYTFDAGITASQVVWSFGKVSSAVRLADKLLAGSRMNKDTTKLEVIYAAKIRYYSTLLADSSVKILRESLENTRHNKELVIQRASGGRSSRRDIIKMDADIAARVPQVNEANTGLSSALRGLKVMIGTAPEAEIVMTDAFAAEYKPLDGPALVKSMRENEPTLQSLRQNIAVYEELTKIRKAGYYPTIAAFATWDYMGGGADYYIGKDNLGGYNAIGLKMNIPLWTSGQTSSQLQQAKIDLQNAKLQLQMVDKGMVLELNNAVAEYNQYIDTLAANQAAVKLAQDSFNMMQDMLASGQVSLTDLNDSELLLTSGKLKLEVTLFNINATIAKIEKMAGKLLWLN